MAERILQTKIALLYKTYAEWEAKKTYVPLKGEVCFCEVPASTGAVASEPCILFKVGDGSKKFENLPWASALAADVYAWAKKANLEFGDLNSDFLAQLDARIAAKSENVEYQMSGSNGVWKLQKREIGAENWTDVSTVDVAGYIAPLLAKKVDKEIAGTNGKALIFNEVDGGGAKFEHQDGTHSFVGVNDGGQSGIAAQIYAVDSTAAGYPGAKLDVTKNGIYYTVGNQPAAERDIAANEIAVKGDIAEYSIVKDAEPGEYANVYHLTKNGENVGAAIEIAKSQVLKKAEVKTCTEKDKPIAGLNPGDKYIDFEWANGTHSYVNLKDLTDTYKADEVTLHLDENNVFSVKAIGIEKVTGLQAALDSKASASSVDNKLDKMPGNEQSGGNAYNLPYFFYKEEQADKVVVHAKTRSLDGNNVYGDYSMDVVAASADKAGLMSAADKNNLDKAILEDDVLILNCNL